MFFGDLQISVSIQCLVHMHYVYEEALEGKEETSGTVNVRNKTEKNIMPHYLVPNTSSDKRYSLETGIHCRQFSALYEGMKRVVYQQSLYILSLLVMSVFSFYLRESAFL